MNCGVYTCNGVSFIGQSFIRTIFVSSTNNYSLPWFLIDEFLSMLVIEPKILWWSTERTNRIYK